MHLHAPRLTPTARLSIVIAVSLCFFIAEVTIGFHTRSLALVADAFHYLNDLVCFVIALGAICATQRARSPKGFSFGWQRAQPLGAFFNGVFLAALGLSIFLKSVERFVSLQRVRDPKLVLIVGAVGFALNVFSIVFLHDHGHGHGHHAHGCNAHSSPSPTPEANPASAAEAVRLSFHAAGPGVHAHHRHTANAAASKKPARDLGLFGVLLHVVGDAMNNVAVMVSAAVIRWGTGEGRFYADPAVGMAVSFVIMATAVPLVKNAGRILLQCCPVGIDLDEVKTDIELLPGVSSVHELHVWMLNQQKTIATAHVTMEDESLISFVQQARLIGECLHAYGVHSYTLQPEPKSAIRPPAGGGGGQDGDDGDPTAVVRQRPSKDTFCLIKYDGLESCKELQCCYD